MTCTDRGCRLGGGREQLFVERVWWKKEGRKADKRKVDVGGGLALGTLTGKNSSG